LELSKHVNVLAAFLFYFLPQITGVKDFPGSI